MTSSDPIFISVFLNRTSLFLYSTLTPSHRITSSPHCEQKTKLFLSRLDTGVYLTNYYFFIIRNQPFAPADRRNALELTESDTAYHLHEDAEPGIPSIRRTLLKGWKDVDTFTRS